MNKKLGIIFILIGTALISGALYLFLANDKEDQNALEHAQNLMPIIYDEIQNNDQPDDSRLEILENTPVELLTPEDIYMTEKEINGYNYIGYLEIQDLGIVLPVMSDWSNRQLQIAPCRYSGTVRGEDLVIMAHNYKSHFGYLAKLTQGSQVIFTDMDGVVWRYEVVVTDILPANAVEEMTAGEYDLTLFTCATNRTHRITVRCNKINPDM